MRDAFSLYFYYCKTSMKAWFQYRVDAFLRIFAVMARESTAVIIMYITFLSFKNIGGWTINELLFLFSFMFLTYGIFIIFFTGLRDFQYMVIQGDLDKLLIRPRGVLFQLLASNSDWFAALGHGLLGIVVFIYSSSKISIEWTMQKIILACSCVCSGVLIQGALFLMFASLSFFIVKTDNLRNVLYWNIKSFMGYPISIYPKLIQYFVVYIIPLAFVNYFPSQLLMGVFKEGNIFPAVYISISAALQSNMSNGEMVEATKKEKIIQRMNYHDLVPYVKKTKMGILELDINFLFDGNKNLIDKNVYEMGTMVYKGRYRITGLNPYTNLAFLCCHFYREATDTIWTEGKRDVTLYKIVDMMNFIRFYREQINYDIMIEVLKKLNIEKKAYFTFKIMTEFYEYEFLSEMLSRLDEYKSGDDEMKAIHDTKNKTTIYRDETFFEKTFARG